MVPSVSRAREQIEVTAAPGALPVLPATPRGQLVLSFAWIGCSLLLLTAETVRISVAVELTWWVPLAVAAGMLAADFLSGLVHWGADTWGRADLPVIGPRLLLPFRIHHVNPDDFLRRSFPDTNGDSAAAVIPVLLVLLWMPLDSVGWQAAAVFSLSLCAFAAMTNQIHQWAHMPSPPSAIRVLQQIRVVLPHAAHAAHHSGAYDAHYCITTGWCNRPLDALRFFRRLEAVITRTTGARPRDDERGSPQWREDVPRRITQ
jgi:ubiquitin-conjugating enzyme E2 variant